MLDAKNVTNKKKTGAKIPFCTFPFARAQHVQQQHIHIEIVISTAYLNL